MAEGTPMMNQYQKIKAEIPDCILFFRLGDFYEMFNEDALLASKELDLALTTRTEAARKRNRPLCAVFPIMLMRVMLPSCLQRVTGSNL
jgi:DNA mismatch repair protein MutS